jgi:sortase A
MKRFSMPRWVPRWTTWVQRGLAITGVVLLGYCLAVFLEARFYQARIARDFERQLRREKPPQSLARPPAAPISPPDAGGILGRLEIPRLGLSVMVVEGAGAKELKRAAGHIPGTALPGQTGNIGIAGHRDTFFRPLRGVRRNDTISLITIQKINHYRVESTEVVAPEDVQVLNPVGHDVLTLVTCFPFNYVGPAPKRFIVHAERME